MYYSMSSEIVVEMMFRGAMGYPVGIGGDIIFPHLHVVVVPGRRCRRWFHKPFGCNRRSTDLRFRSLY